MKKRNTILILAAVLAASILFSGCVGLGDIVFAVLGGESAGASTDESVAESESTPESAASSSLALPAAESMAPSSSASSAPAAPVAEESPGPRVTDEVLAMFGQTNADVRAMNGNSCYSYIFYGGSAVADYSQNPSVAYPFAFLYTPNQEALLAYWNEKNGGSPDPMPENIWPDDYTVDMIEAWESGISAMFGTAEPVTYAMLEEAYGQSPELALMGEGPESYDFDVWTGIYDIDGLTLEMLYTSDGTNYNAYMARLG